MAKFEDLPADYVNVVNGFGSSWPVEFLKTVLVKAWENNMQLPDFGFESEDVYIHTATGCWCVCSDESLQVLRIGCDKEEEFRGERLELGMRILLCSLPLKIVRAVVSDGELFLSRPLL